MLEDEELWAEYCLSHTPELREKLIYRYAHLVKYVAGRLAIGLPANQEEDDLAGYGIFGLLDAFDRFDPQRGVKFETYASPRIRGAILDGLRSYDQVPVSWRRRAKGMEKAVWELENELGRNPEDGEVAIRLGVSSEELNQWLSDFGKMTVVSLEETLFTQEDDLAGEESDPVEVAQANERRGLLAGAIDRLSDKERTVLGLYYYEELTVKEIAQVMGLSNSRISQLHQRAILRLRGFLAKAKKILTTD